MRLAWLGMMAACSACSAGKAPAPLAVVLVYSGETSWIGSEDYQSHDTDAVYSGVLKPLEAALDASGLAGLHGTFEAIEYNHGTFTKVPRESLAAVHGNQLGVQKDYFGWLEHDLVAGVTAGLDELGKTPATRRVLIVVGDGNNTKPASLAALKDRAAHEHIEIIAIAVQSPAASREPKDIGTLVEQPRVLASTAELPAELASVVASLR